MYCNFSNKYNCKNKSIIIIKQKNICLKHFNIYYKKYILLIQKVYKGYKCRKKIKTIFYDLPRDIQKIVLYYINLPIYYRRYYNKLQDIIYNKSNYLFTNNKFNINNIIKSYNLYNKYYIILNLNFLKYSYVLAKDILCQLNNDLYYVINNYHITNIIHNYLFLDNNLINIDNEYDTNNIIDTIIILTKFIKIYEKKYNIIKLI